VGLSGQIWVGDNMMMYKRRDMFHFLSAATLTASGLANAKAATTKRFRHYPFDPVAAENFQHKLFIPIDSGPFGVLDVAGALTMRATTGSLALLPGKPSPFLLYQTEQSGKTYQNPILRINNGANLRLTLRNELAEPTIIHWHGLQTPSKMDGHPASTIDLGQSFENERYPWDRATS
jgi:suppressor of ftsI/bilirubin oxidase